MTDTAHPAQGIATGEPLWQLTRLGQSVWLDYIRRDMLVNGDLERMIREDAVRGVTSNPAIFQQAIGESDAYDRAIEQLASEQLDPTTAYERLAVEDIRMAADLFREIYETSGGRDGFVSLEVSPELARDTGGSLEEARRLWSAVDRPNLMVKIPGTEEGLPAIEEALVEGINVNVTLLFSVGIYERVIEHYLRALERRIQRGDAVDHIASVASFFVSRVDTAVDRLLEERAENASSETERDRLLDLRGRAAVANAKLAYRRFREIFDSERFQQLQRAGARVQRPLWASTSTKNPRYRDVIYVEELIGPDTVNTMPLQTIAAFADHGVARRTVDDDLDAAEADLRAIADAGIDLDEVTARLQEEGVDKFVIPFRHLLGTIEERLSVEG